MHSPTAPSVPQSISGWNSKESPRPITPRLLLAAKYILHCAYAPAFHSGHSPSSFLPSPFSIYRGCGLLVKNSPFRNLPGRKRRRRPGARSARKEEARATRPSVGGGYNKMLMIPGGFHILSHATHTRTHARKRTNERTNERAYARRA